VEVVEDLCDGCGKCVEVCARSVLKLDEGKVKVADVLKCTLCGDCVEACPKDAINVGKVDGSFIFYLESTGAMPPEDVMIKSADVLSDKAKRIINALEEAL